MLSTHGYQIIDDFICKESLEAINRDIESHEKIKDRYGIGHAEKALLAVNNYVSSLEFIEKAQLYLDGNVEIKRAIVFNKTEDNNWAIGWHQDRAMTISNEDVKKLPLDWINKMITICIHLDDVSEKNGCMKIMPKTHKIGLLSPQKINEYTAENSEVYCEGSAGSALVMRSHMIHGSDFGSHPSQRRVLHLELCSQFPCEVQWPYTEYKKTPLI